MRINNPKLFNGDLLATKKQITTWLQETSTETFEGKLATSVIPISGVTPQDGVFPIYGTTVLLNNGVGAPTISEKFESIEAQIGAVKKYEATKAADTAITVSTSSATDASGIVTDTFVVGLNLDGTSLTQTGTGLKVTDDYVEGIASGITQELQVVKLGGGDDPTLAARYQLQFNGVVLGDTIDMVKDQFLSGVEFVEGTGSGDDVLRFNFITASGTVDTVDVPLTGLFNEYTKGPGIDIQPTATGLEISGVVDPTSDSYLTVGTNGFKLTGVSDKFDAVDDNIEYLSAAIDYVSGVVSGHTEDISYISGIVDDLSGQITNTNKFIEVQGDVTGVVDKVNDTLYYNSDGQAMIWDNDTWHNISMEALTTIDANVSDTTTATSKAIKTYVDAGDAELRADLDIVSGDLDTLEDTVGNIRIDLDTVSGNLNIVSGDLDALEARVDTIENTLPKKAEIFTVSKTFGGETTATVSGRIIAVYDSNGAQVYPDITYANNVSTLSADDISTTETFTVVYVTATEQAGA